jgi:hypothetical protein
MRKNLVPLLLLTLLSGCDHIEKATDEGDKIAKKLAQDLGISDTNPEQIEKIARAEVDKLKKVEYRVDEISARASSKEIESRLAWLGSDGWDCFHVQPSQMGETLKIFCKRRPTSYLRYLTQNW